MQRAYSRAVPATHTFQTVRPKGFTLVELMVTIAVAAILVAIAVPSFTSIFNSNRLTSHVNELAAGIQSARMEAIRRNARVVICRSDDGATCIDAAGSWDGWISFVDTDQDFAPDAGVDSLLRTASAAGPVTIVASPAVSGDSNRIVIRPDGMARGIDRRLVNATLRVCIATTQPDENQRDLTINAGSRLSITRADGGGACAAPADPA